MQSETLAIYLVLGSFYTVGSSWVVDTFLSTIDKGTFWIPRELVEFLSVFYDVND